jgi:phage-related protein
MATPADNLERIADLASDIRDFTYNSSNNLSFIDTGISDLTQEIVRNFANAQGYLSNIYSKLIEILDAIKKMKPPKDEKKKIKAEEKKQAEAGKEKKKESGSSESNIKDAGETIKKMTEVAAGSFFKYVDEAEAGFAILSDGMLTAAAGIESLAAVATAAGAAIAASAVAIAVAPKMFMNLVNAVSTFVKALDPGLMAQLSLAMSDLQATIGVGLRPIIQAAIPIIRAFADTLMPLMNQLAPVIQQFGNSMLKIAVPVIAIWADAISFLIPIIEGIIPLFVDLSEILMILTPVFSFLFETLYRSVNFVIGIFHSFMVGLKAMTVAVLEAGAWLVSWVSKSKSEALKAMAEEAKSSMGRSMEAQAQAFGKALGDRPARAAYTPGASVGAAAKQASYSGIADLGKNMMQAAFGQSAQNAALQTADNTKVMADGFGKLVGWIMGQGKPNAPQQGVR